MSALEFAAMVCAVERQIEFLMPLLSDQSVVMEDKLSIIDNYCDDDMVRFLKEPQLFNPKRIKSWNLKDKISSLNFLLTTIFSNKVTKAVELYCEDAFYFAVLLRLLGIAGQSKEDIEALNVPSFINGPHPDAIFCTNEKDAIREVLRRYFRWFPCSSGRFGRGLTTIIVSSNETKQLTIRYLTVLIQLVSISNKLNVASVREAAKRLIKVEVKRPTSRDTIERNNLSCADADVLAHLKLLKLQNISSNDLVEPIPVIGKVSPQNEREQIDRANWIVPPIPVVENGTSLCTVLHFA